jgi:hypothetical protein
MARTNRQTGMCDITPYLKAETARIGELMRAGIVETVLLKADQSGAFLFVRTADLASARDAVEACRCFTPLKERASREREPRTRSG